MVLVKTEMEIVKSLQYKLHIMWVEVLGPPILFGYNKSVFKGSYITHPKWSQKIFEYLLSYRLWGINGWYIKSWFR